MNNAEKTINWYIRLHDKFFSDQEIAQIEKLPESKYGHNFGSFVIHLYFKLLCNSTKNNGVIYFDLNLEENNDFAYSIAKRFFSESKLAETKQALMMLSYFDLIEITSDINGTTVFLPAVISNTGRCTEGADRKRRRLAEEKNKMLAGKTEQTVEKVRAYGTLQNVYLTESEYQDILSRVNNDKFKADACINSYGIELFKQSEVDTSGNETVSHYKKVIDKMQETAG